MNREKLRPFRPVILVAGGGLHRVIMGADFAASFPHRPGHAAPVLVIASEPSPATVRAEIADAVREHGASALRFVLDFQSWDTCSHLTALRALWRELDPTDLYLVTGLEHARRFEAIAAAYFALRWHRVRVHSAPSVLEYPSRIYATGPVVPRESDVAVARDVARILVYRLTGWIPSSPSHKRRMKALVQTWAAEDSPR